MEDFRYEYKEKKKRNGWTVFLTFFSIIALVFSSAALYRTNRLLTTEEKIYEGNNVELKIAQTSSTQGQTPAADSGTNSVVNVAESMKSKVVYVGVYGKSSSFSNSVQYALIGSGSGFIISEDGYIVTNYHVIEQGKSYKVTVNSNEEFDAEVVGYDSYSDLAVLKIVNANKKFESVTLGDSDAVKVGEMAIAIGSPLDEALNNTVTVGYISAKDREINSSSHKTKMIQTDAAVNPGNSGGPLLNASGQVIGINTMKSTFAGYDSYGNAISADGISFAIPISDAMPIITSIIKEGKYRRPGLGITYYTIDSEISSKNDIPEGLLIKSVTPGSPASKAGLMADDIIINVDGKEIKTGSNLDEVLKEKKVGDKIKITVDRDGNKQEVELELGDLNEISQSNENRQKNDESNWKWPF